MCIFEVREPIYPGPQVNRFGNWSDFCFGSGEEIVEVI